MPEPLQQFYAVTKSGHSVSLYLVFADGTRHEPCVKKLELRGESSVSPGERVVGPQLSIGANLILYFPEGGGYLGSYEREVEMVNTRYWLFHTAKVVGLFLDEAAARACFAREDFQPSDPRWVNETKAVLEAVGEDHPQFAISQGRATRLPLPEAA